MKKILVIGLFCLFGCTFTPANTWANDTATIDSSKNDVQAIQSSDNPAQQKVIELEALEKKVEAAHQNIKKEHQKIIDDYNRQKSIFENEKKDYQKEIDTLEKENKTTNAPKIAELKQKKKTTQESLDTYNSNNQAEFKKAQTTVNQAYQALTAVQAAKGKHTSSVQAQQQKEKLNNIVNSSSTFDPDDFLSIGNERSLNLDAENEDNIISRILRYMVRVLGTFGVIMMIIAGMFMITSEGDETRLQKGKNIFLYTAIGLLVAFTSYALIQFILSVLFS